MVHFFHWGNWRGFLESRGRKSTRNGEAAVPSPGYVWLRTSGVTPAWSKTMERCETLVGCWASTSTFRRFSSTASVLVDDGVVVGWGSKAMVGLAYQTGRQNNKTLAAPPKGGKEYQVVEQENIGTREKQAPAKR